MRLKLYRAASVAEAMAQLRSELGPDALILSTRRIAQGVELTAALDQAEEAAPEPGTDFAYHGIPPAIAARLAGGSLAQALRAVLRFGTLPVDGAQPLLLAGAPGAGKTLSVARLATRLVLAGVRPLVITADGRRAGAAEELAAYTRLLGLTLLVAGTPATVARALRQRDAAAPVLIDTTGINPFAADQIEQVALLIQAAEARPVLVIPAGQHPEEAAEQAGAFAALGVDHLLPTRLDVARRLGSVIAAAVAADLMLTDCGTGSGATDGLAPLTPEFLAERLRRPGAPPAVPPPVAAAPARRPVFPTARSRAAELWGGERYGDDGYRN
jgi:flagellar biosynthesis protein FlhF